jgi:hypothetical protein
MVVPPDEVSGKQGLKPNCDEELRRIPDLLKFFANRIQAGEEHNRLLVT